MAGKSRGWRIYWRGDAAWVSWADGKGGKVRQRIFNEGGVALDRGSSTRDLNRAAAAAYEQWCHAAEAHHGGGAVEITLGRLSEEYVRSRHKDWDKKTKSAYLRYISYLENYFGPDRSISSLQEMDFERFKQWLETTAGRRGNGLHSRTVSNHVDFYTHMFDWGCRKKLISENGFRDLDPIKVTPVRKGKPFTSQEVATLLTYAQAEMPWFFDVLLFIALTGSRRGPVPLIEVRDFDPVTGKLEVRPEISKRQKGHLYALPPVLVERLRVRVAGREPHEKLFLDDEGKELSVKVFDKPDKGKSPARRARAWHYILERAGIKPRGVHNLRRSATTVLANADVTIDKITSVVGNTVEIARKHYLSIEAESQRQVINKLASIYKLHAEAVGEQQDRGTVVIELTREDAEDLRTWLETLRQAGNGTLSGTNEESENANMNGDKGLEKLAEREGFEPSVELPLHTRSRRAP